MASTGQLPAKMLRAPMRARIAATRASGVKEMPPLLDRAVEADLMWAEAFRENLGELPYSLAADYVSVYGAYSARAHASVRAVDDVTIQSGEMLKVGALESDRRAPWTPHSDASKLLMLTLLICARRLGWPAEADVWQAYVTPGGRRRSARRS